MLTKYKIAQMVAVTICLFVATTAAIQAENKSDASASHANWGQMSQAMQKSMDPQVMNNMMNMMMTSPDKLMTMESCAQCHTGEEVQRYQKDFGPMMEAMKPMMSMMNPMMGMMYPMMAPMVNPMMGMMNPMMAPTMGMMSPMMNPMMDMSGAMMSPMMGMMNPMMAPMMNPMGMMDPKQYEQWFNMSQPKK